MATAMWQKQPRNRLYKGFITASLAAWLFFWNFTAILHAAEPPWLTGEALRQALDNSVAVTWGNTPTRQALKRFSQSQRVAVILDRRIDPDRKIELAIKDVPLEVALNQIASRLHGSRAMVGPIAYFGPSAAVNRVRTIVALRTVDIAKLPTRLRSPWQRLRPWKWEDLAEPRDLLVSLARDLGVTIDGLEQVPHDLWSAADLPAMSLPERLTLILNQFDLTYELENEGKTIHIVPAPDRPQIELSYPVGQEANQIAAKFSTVELLTEAKIHVADGKLVVLGTAEDHDMVRDLLAGGTAKRISTQEGSKRYTLRVELPVGKALEQLGKQMGLEIQIDRDAIAEAGLSLDHKVKIDVKEATFDELFEALLIPAGLTFTRSGDVLAVKPQK